MSENVEIKLDLGDGLHTTQENKLAVYYDGTNGNIVLDNSANPGENGLYVKDLNGADGTDGGSTHDNHTLIAGTAWKTNDHSDRLSPFPEINRSVVQMIFTFGLYYRSMRHPSTISYSSTVKSVEHICNEINAPCVFNYSSYTSYRPAIGEMIQLVDGPNFRTVPWGGSTIACENGNRNNDNNMTTRVIFVILAIRYKSDVGSGSDYIVHDMNLKCIYSTVPDYVVGNNYYGAANDNTV